MAIKKIQIGKYLKRFREHFNLKQNKVAESIGMTPQQYMRYEKDIMSPPVALVINIAEIFNVSADYLLGISDDPRPAKIDPRIFDLVRLLQEWKDAPAQ